MNATLITLDPGHFHAALIQKEMYPEVAPRVAVYAPLGPDVIEHLTRVARFNLRPENPTHWELDVHTGPDFFARMLRERPGNVVVLSGRNRGKIDRIQASVEAGLHVLADKPWIIRVEDLPKLEATLAAASRLGVVAYDIMTERYEITSILQRELVNDDAVFGIPVPGTPAEPGVYMESVHHIMKMVAGVPNLRPPWFFDVAEQGEALTDVGTHLVDLVQWTLFPSHAIDHRREIEVQAASRWPLAITPAQFRQVTGETRAADLPYYCNTSVSYTLRGIHAKLDVLWRYEAPAGTGDTFTAVFRGSHARVEIRQGAAEGYQPELYVVPQASGVRDALQAKVAALQAAWPDIGIENIGTDFKISIPAQYRVGHEAHFAQVTRAFFKYLNAPGSMPKWEAPGMLAKYSVTTRGVQQSQPR